MTISFREPTAVLEGNIRPSPLLPFVPTIDCGHSPLLLQNLVQARTKDTLAIISCVSRSKAQAGIFRDNGYFSGRAMVRGRCKCFVFNCLDIPAGLSCRRAY